MKNILTKLHKIMQEVDYIQKDKTNTFHKYNYASEQAIKEKLHAKLVEHGVLFSISVTAFTNTTVKTAKGNEETLTTLNLTYSFIDIETTEVFAGEFVGSGQDSGDKGVYKAITGAIKYILTSTFLIPTGDDPEEGKESFGTDDDGDEEAPLDDVANDYDGPLPTLPKPLHEGDPCPRCEVGTMKLRKGSKGPFLGCNAFPDCKHTSNV